MQLISTFNRILLSAALALGAGAAVADGHGEKEPMRGERAMAVEVEAEVVAVDMETRELSLRLPTGEQLTTVVDPAVQRLNEVSVGDFIVVTYLAALAGEVREPTEEELANPWVEGIEADVAGMEEAPGGAMVAGVRAVCTIEGMNRLLGTVMIMDPRGKTHIIGDVPAERIEQLSIGQTVVMTFTQAVAVGLAKVEM